MSTSIGFVFDITLAYESSSFSDVGRYILEDVGDGSRLAFGAMIGDTRLECWAGGVSRRDVFAVPSFLLMATTEGWDSLDFLSRVLGLALVSLSGVSVLFSYALPSLSPRSTLNG